MTLKMRYIVRFEHESGNSGYWQVKFQKGSDRSGKKTVVAQRTFMDRKYGGKRKALKAAKDWRDEMAVRLNKIEQPHALFKRYQTHAQNSTGVVGVYHVEGADSKGRYRNHYRVEWREADEYGKRQPRAKLFTIGTANKEKVFREAVRWRKQMEKLHYQGAQKNR